MKNQRRIEHTQTGIGLRLTKKDLPKLQLKGQGHIPFPQEEIFDKAEYFLRSFEKVIFSSDQDINVVWKKYVPLTLPLEYDAWLNNDLLSCDTWKDARLLFEKTFGNALLKLQARKTVMTMRMKNMETVNDYAMKFNRAIGEAGYGRSERILGDIFLCGFPEEWQVQINTVLISTHQGQDTFTIQDIAASAQSVFGNKTPNDLGSWSKTTAASKWADSDIHKRRRPDTDSNSNKNMRRKNNFFCSRHGGDNADHNESDCYSNKKGNIAEVKPSCRYCGNPWSLGHKCKEYYDKKDKRKNILILATDAQDNSTNESSSLNRDEETRLKEALEDEYDCKLKQQDIGIS
ncbi:hypothetical protein EDC96DRAFT_490853 [Choanephora cucurbitarum]|nr:hypothetical protein EDC96DRAFT_490853 [Choanephora cucurbitarum]